MELDDDRQQHVAREAEVFQGEARALRNEITAYILDGEAGDILKEAIREVLHDNFNELFKETLTDQTVRDLLDQDLTTAVQAGMQKLVQDNQYQSLQTEIVNNMKRFIQGTISSSIKQAVAQAMSEANFRAYINTAINQSIESMITNAVSWHELQPILGKALAKVFTTSQFQQKLSAMVANELSLSLEESIDQHPSRRVVTHKQRSLVPSRTVPQHQKERMGIISFVFMMLKEYWQYFVLVIIIGIIIAAIISLNPGPNFFFGKNDSVNEQTMSEEYSTPTLKDFSSDRSKGRR